MSQLSFLRLVTLSVLVVANRVALNLSKRDSLGNDVPRGTEEPDLLDGRAGNDTIIGDSGEESTPRASCTEGLLDGRQER